MAGIADTAIQFGLSQIGKPYKTGALFTQACYHAAGIRIPAYAMPQAFRAGAEVRNPKRNLSPGDLVFPTLRIVQIYIGENWVLGVTKSGVGKYPVRRIQRAVRITTPGGGAGLSLAVPGQTPAPMVTRPHKKMPGKT